MKKALIDYVKRGSFDELYTPRYAIEPLMSFIPYGGGIACKNPIVWCPFDTQESEIVKVAKEHHLEVISSHISDGKDFFKYEPEEYDMIISNPPYSIKDDVLERCFSLGKPFALLLPITALEGTKRGKMFKDNGIDLLVLDKRVDFNGKGKCWFNTSWFCSGFNFDGIQFIQINKD